MSKIHNSRKWKKKRDYIKKRDGYLCRECRRYGRNTQAQLVHHIYPVEDYPELALNNDNLISLCVKCHELMHDRADNEVTTVGERWQNKKARKIFPRKETSPPT